MIPILYEKNEVAFTTNGLGRLTDCIKVLCTEGLNDIYTCDFSYPVTGRLFDQITLGRVIAVTHEDSQDLQPFDIVSYTKPINGVVTFHCTHASYRLTKYIARPTFPINSAPHALTMFRSAEPQDGVFSFSAPDFDFIHDTGFMASTAGRVPRSVREYIGGIEGSFLDTYGGEITWDKFNVIFNKRRGQQRDFYIRYGVNLADYTETADGSGTYTAAVPFWTDGETTIVGSLVDSGLTPYDRAGAKALDLSDVFDTQPTTAELEAKALEVMTDKQTNLPKRTISIDFVRLQDLDGYEGFDDLLKCQLGDSIGVLFPAYGVSGQFRIVKTVWNVLTNRYEEMTLGALETTLAQALGVGQATIAKGGSANASKGYFFGTCTTAQGTAAKVVSCPEFTANDLAAGTVLYVDFTAANTIANPTLNVNSTGAKPIYRYGTTRPSTSAATSWNAGSIVCLIYDGAGWTIEGWNNTTYSSMTVAEYEAGTGTTAELITPARLKGAIQYWAGTVTDYITEEDTANGWTWRKWASGLQEAWYSGSITFSAAGSSVAGWYRSTQNVNLPLTFADNATITVTGAYSGRIFTSGGIKTSGTQFEAQILGGAAMGAGAVSGWNVYVIGNART